MTHERLAAPLDFLPNGVLLAALPTPFPVGPVNCYLLPEPPVTLVDPGMLWDHTPERIEALCREARRSLADIDQIVVTHGHPDHFGAAESVAEIADAPIICGRPEAAKLVHPFEGMGAAGLVDGFGMPDDVRASLPGFAGLVREMVRPVRADRLDLVDDGDTIAAGGRSWQVRVTPGHAVGHVSLWDAEGGVLLSGDHLLAEITPNPLIEADDSSPLGRRRSLVEYLASLDRFVALQPAAVLGGHGPAFADVATLSARTRVHHARRAEMLLGVVRELGEPTAYDLSCRLFPDLDGFSHLLGISEVLGHLDLLADAGAVTFVDAQPQRFVAA